MYSIPSPKQSQLAKQVPPDLLSMLSKLAVDQAAQHWQQQQAMQQGQTPPTVAETAGKQAEQVMQQQLAQRFAQSNPPQSQQQQAQGLPGAVTPQPQGGGIDQLPSNLPQSYAGGGVVSFDEGGYAAPDMGDLYDVKAMDDSDYWTQLRKAASFIGSVPAGALRALTGYDYSGASGAKAKEETPSPVPMGYSGPTNGPGQLSLNGTSLERLVAAAQNATDPEDRTGMLAQLQAQFGTEAVTAAMRKPETPAQDTLATSPPPAPTPATSATSPTAAPPAEPPTGLANLRQFMMDNVARNDPSNPDNDVREKSRLYHNKLYGDDFAALKERYTEAFNHMRSERDKEKEGRSTFHDFALALAKGAGAASKGDWAQALLGTGLAYEDAMQKRKESDKAWAERLLQADVDITKLGINLGEKMAAAGDAAVQHQSSAYGQGLGQLATLDNSNAVREQTAAQRAIANRMEEAKFKELQATHAADKVRREAEARQEASKAREATYVKLMTEARNRVGMSTLAKSEDPAVLSAAVDAEYKKLKRLDDLEKIATGYTGG